MLHSCDLFQPLAVVVAVAVIVVVVVVVSAAAGERSGDCCGDFSLSALDDVTILAYTSKRSSFVHAQYKGKPRFQPWRFEANVSGQPSVSLGSVRSL